MAGTLNAIQLSSISQINQQEFLLLCFCARPRRRSQEDLLWREPGKACKARRDFVHSGKYRISHLFPHKYERVSFLPLNCFNYFLAYLVCFWDRKGSRPSRPRAMDPVTMGYSIFSPYRGYGRQFLGCIFACDHPGFPGLISGLSWKI